MATLHRSTDDAAPVPYVPRVRSLIFRGMWGELPENKHNPAPMNERVYESDMPTFTTDVRMEKIPDLFASGVGDGEAWRWQGSGGGGPVEALWWIKEVMTQWRVQGEAFVVGPDIEADDGHDSSGARTVKTEVGRRMRSIDQAKEEDWSWARELTAHFGNMSPIMRGRPFSMPGGGTGPLMRRAMVLT